MRRDIALTENNFEKVSGLFGKKPLLLVASPPRNDVELAMAAEAGGADLLKVHLNVRHAASGTMFGSLLEERDVIENILSSVKIPVGVMPGSEYPASLEEMKTLEKMGISFFDIYTSDMPAEYLLLEKMEAMAAIGYGWKEWEPEVIYSMGVTMLEASVVHHEEYGKRLDFEDLETYSYIAKMFKGSVVAPTQKAIRPEEIPLLYKAGVKGIMIGKIVAGDRPSVFEATAKKFAAAIDRL